MKRTIFIKSIAAGICIGIGSTVYLSCDNHIVGAFLFAIGLLAICSYSLELFTGKIGYVIDNHNALDCLLVWLGNLSGCILAVVPLRITKPAIALSATEIIHNKPDNFFTLLVCGFFCGMIMFIAVDNYRKGRNVLGKYLPILFGIPTFILCGFEHSIANMCYCIYGINSLQDLNKSIYIIIVVTIANSIGAIFANWIFTHDGSE